MSQQVSRLITIGGEIGFNSEYRRDDKQNGEGFGGWRTTKRRHQEFLLKPLKILAKVKSRTYR